MDIRAIGRVELCSRHRVSICSVLLIAKAGMACSPVIPNNRNILLFLRPFFLFIPLLPTSHHQVKDPKFQPRIDITLVLRLFARSFQTCLRQIQSPFASLRS
jgi:hypothetical protein